MAVEQGREFSLRDAPAPGAGAGSAVGRAMPDVAIQDERVNLRQYSRTILYHKWYALIALAVVLAFVEVYSYRQPERFRATTTLLRQSGEEGGGMKTKMLGLVAGGSGGGVGADALSQMVLQRPVLEAVLARFQGISLETLEPLLGGKAPDQAPAESDVEFLRGLDLGSLLKSLEVMMDPSGQLMHITVDSTRRVAPAVIANAVAEAFQKRMVDLKQETSRFDAQQIDTLLDEKKREIVKIGEEILRERERLSRELAEEAGNKDSDALATEVQVQMEMLKRKQIELEQSLLLRMATVNVIEGLKTRLAREPAEIVIESRYDNPLKSRLVDLRIQLQTLMAQFTADHPKIKSIQKDIEATEGMLAKSGKGEVGAEVRGPNPMRGSLEQQIASREAELSGLDGRIGALRSSIEQNNEQLKTLPSKVLPLERLKARSMVLERIIVNLEQELESSRLAQISKKSSLTLAESALVPLGPYSPKRKQLRFMGLLVGIILGIVVAFLLEALDDTIKTSEDITRVLRVVPLGIVPEWTSKEDVLINPDNPKSGISEIFGVLRNNIRHASAEHPEKRLLIASSLQGEGKSMIATNLAISYAMEGNKTFLIDMDLRKAGRHRLLDVVGVEAAPTVGLSDYLEDKAKLQEIICQTAMEGLFYISSGSRVRNPARLLRSRRLVELLELLEKKLDVVVIDAPAVLPVVDTSLVAVHARGVVMVVQAESNPSPVAKQGVDRLRHINAPVLGAVLNRASSLSLKHFHYYGTGTYYYRESGSDSRA